MAICKKCGKEFDARKPKAILALEKKFGFSFSASSMCNKCEKVIEKEQDKTDRENAEKKLITGFPERYKKARLTDFAYNKIVPVMEWIENPKGTLYIHGACGTGKTHLLYAICYYFRKDGKKADVYFALDIINKIKDSFNVSGKIESEIKNRIKDSKKITMIDNFGTEKNSEFVKDLWTDIINTKYIDKSPLVITSNATISDVSKNMSDIIASRLADAEGTIFKMAGVDRRI